MTKTSLFWLAVCVFTLGTAKSQSQSIYEPYYFTTLAGTALSPGTQDDTGSLARFDQPWGLAVDAAHNVYVADTLNQVIRKITPGGAVSTVAGIAGSAGYNDGAVGTAQFSRPTGVAVNSAGTVIYVADYNNQVIRQISGGMVSTVAGMAGVTGTTDATGTSAQFHNPFGVALNSAGTILYVTDQNNQSIRAITLSSGAVVTFAGASGVSGSTDDPANALNARFNTPKGIAVDGNGNIYVADTGNFTVRKVAAGGGATTTLAGLVNIRGFADGAGNAATFSQLSAMSPFGGPCGLAVDGTGTIYVTDQGNHLIRKITAAGSVTTLAGLAQVSGSSDGAGNVAGFNFPAGMAVDNTGTLYVADTANHTIRRGVNASTNNSCLTFTAPTNKLVACDAAWDFDAPTNIADACCTNFAVVFNTVTNGTSPLVVVRTWWLNDSCGNSASCLQTVTVDCATNGVGGSCTNFVVNGSFELTSPAMSPGSFNNALDPLTGVPGWTTAATNTLEIWCNTVGGIPATDGTNQLEINAQSADETVSQTVTGLSTTCPVTFCFDYTGRFGLITNAVGPVTPNNDFTVSLTGKDFAFSVPLNPTSYATGGWVRFCTNFVPPDATFTIAFHGQPHYSDGTIYTEGGSHIDNVSLTQCCLTNNTCTTPPIITCPTNTIVVALNKDCMLEIPTIQPVAADGCSPTGQLTYLQDPAAGTVVPGPSRTVTIVVQDARGNASQCQVQVYGQDKTPPIIIAPKAISLTNCVVPDVSAFVLISDPCTPTNKLIFSQSPPPGTPIAPGVHQVAVTVTDPAGNATTVIIPLTSSGSESFLNVLFNTGVDASKTVLPGDSVDPHYTLGPVPVGTPTGVGHYNAPAAIVVGVPPYTASQWIDPGRYTFETSFPAGTYTYTNQFVLPAGTDPTSASISGRWMADNGATMYLNGLAPANQVAFMPLGGYYAWTYFTINSGFLAYPAVNRLYFVVTNYSLSPTLLRVEFTDASINCGTCTPPTILQTTSDQSRSVNSTAVFHATVGGTPPFTIVWYHNGQQVVDGGHYSGAATTTLTVTPLSTADAGTYSIDVYGACGKAASAPSKLTVTPGWGPWPWAWWNFHDPFNPMKAIVGPDLVFTGTTLFGFVAGTTFDVGLPNIGGQIANVLDVPAMLSAGTYLQIPAIGPGDGSVVSNYTLIADVYVPSNSVTRSMIMSIFDRWGNMFVTATSSGTLNVSGMLGDEAINQDYSMALMPDAWNRVALVIATTSSTTDSNRVEFMACCNGKHIGGAYADISTDSTATFVATVGTAPDSGTNGEIYLSSIQFHATAFTPEMLAGLGSPATGPLTANDTSVGMTPMMSAKVSGGMANFMWLGSTFLLQETTDLSSGIWLNSTLPFDEQADVSGKIMTTAHADPAMAGPAKYYRLIYQP
ncbi:MAG TPA: immunoglobulin domain-containing protein [Verrucomicrobiae bacterium]|jgi:DNA-binding beta-propeller fold protein YncE